jgi:hypothetical protein
VNFYIIHVKFDESLHLEWKWCIELMDV